MTAIIRYSYLIPRKVMRICDHYYSQAATYYKFKVFNVRFSSFVSNGVPVIDLYDGARMVLGAGFKMNNGSRHNRIGRQQSCFFIANNGGLIEIGENVGMSSTAINCSKSVRIGDNVRIGGNTVIYDSDFHSLDAAIRTQGKEKMTDILMKAVVIGNNVFIGAHSTILKGVTVGDNSIIGAGSVVTRSIPSNEIWGGNPAQFIKAI
jgi:acetyltransferase-like isoleucine patch superfamily enzyme